MLSCNLTEEEVVHVPADLLLLEVALGSVKLDSPNMELIIEQANTGGKTAWLVADTAGVDVTMSRRMRKRFPVDGLHDINLATGRPRLQALPVRIPQHPESRPDPLLPLPRIASQPQRRLDPRDLAITRQDRVLALDATGCPAVGRGGVAPRDDLQGALAGTAEEDVLGAGREALELVVVVLVAGDDVPVGRVGEGAFGADKGGLPEACIGRVLGGFPGGGRCYQGGEGGEELHS